MAKRVRIKIGIPTLIFFALLLFGGGGRSTLIPFCAALLHEFGHVAAIAFCGQKIKRITLLPFGIDIKAENTVTSYKADILVSSAGILTNILLVIISKFFPQNSVTELFVLSNIMLIAVNILPIKSLDGGQILEKLLAYHFSIETADKITNICSLIFIILLGSFAIWVFFYSAYNFTLLMLCIYLFCSIFLKG